MNLASILKRTASAHADRVAVRLGDDTTSFAELDRASGQIVGLLQERGVQPGDRVAIMLPNVPAFAVVYYGVLRAGGVVVPMNPLLKAREVAYYLGDSGARLIFGWYEVAEEVRKGATETDAETVVVHPATFADLVASTTPVPEIVDRDDEETAVILYTSGTTGKPKGAELTHANLSRNVEVVRTDLLHLTPADVIFGGLPLFHSFGQTCTLNAAVAAGASLSLLPRFDARQALEILAGHRATVFAGVPTMYGALLAYPERVAYDVSGLRVCMSGGASMSLGGRTTDKFKMLVP
jgi:long-chain acyl-CoA synthetase